MRQENKAEMMQSKKKKTTNMPILTESEVLDIVEAEDSDKVHITFMSSKISQQATKKIHTHVRNAFFLIWMQTRSHHLFVIFLIGEKSHFSTIIELVF